MQYLNTRGHGDPQSFSDILLTGLAPGGGLFMPEQLPKISSDTLKQWRSLPYDQLAYEVIWPFVAGDIESGDFKRILQETYSEGVFRHKAIAPLKQLSHQQWVLELFHGPTLAFKDFALQLLGRLLHHILQKRHEKIVILGATSGDTGSAAIHGCMHCEEAEIIILHPEGRVSDVQRRQMTTVSQANVHNVALKGSFDDCQDIVKALFQEQNFLGGERQLVAVNSINWARIMAQIVYYFYAALQLGAPDREVVFSVPTGNFGDIFAGYLAKQMGLPIHKLLIATNQNDVLHRIMTENRYKKSAVIPSIAPSMDIMISSNFERMLYEVYQQDGKAINQLMTQFKHGNDITFTQVAYQRLTELFDSQRADDAVMQAMIRACFHETDEIIEPHTATGIYAASNFSCNLDIPIITLATAHPAKFPKAVEDAIGVCPSLPPHLHDLFDLSEQFDVVENSQDAVKDYIKQQVG